MTPVNVLLVDDHEENLTALSAVLEPLGENLVLARSGSEALHNLLRDDFALILLDVHMPGLGGFETARYITARERTRHIPIIFLTAFAADIEEVFRGYAAGAVDYVTKPFEPQVLRSKVAVFVALHRERAQRLVAMAAQARAEAAYEHEHDLVEHLQRSLLPQELPAIPRFESAARYLPSVQATAVGGDWYDVLGLADGAVALVIGDVVGHGVQAATVMGELRNGLRAYVIEGHGPAAALTELNALVVATHGARMVATVLVMLIEAAVADGDGAEAGADGNGGGGGGRRRLRFASAGHLPPLRLGADGKAAFLAGGLVGPLGMVGSLAIEEAVEEIGPDETILLYTDGLIERRKESLDQGLRRLRAGAEAHAEEGLEAFCDQILRDVGVDGDGQPDDVALVALRLAGDRSERLALRLAAEPSTLRGMRRELTAWLRRLGASQTVIEDLILACSEAAANAVEHAYGPGDHEFELEAEHREGTVRVEVRDFGGWRTARGELRGTGLKLIHQLSDTVEVRRTKQGTTVELSRRLAGGDDA